MPHTTQFSIISMAAGADLSDSDNWAAHIMKDVGDILLEAEGMQQFKFGVQVENPDALTLFLNWDSKAHHDEFQATEACKRMYKRFESGVTAPPDIVRVDFKPEDGLAAALSAPVTEVAKFYFDGGPPENAYEGVQKCLDALQEEGHNLLGWAYGTTYEDLEREGKKGKGAVLVIGWDTVDAHMEARKGSAFKQNVDHLRNGAEGIAMHHTSFAHYVKGFGLES